MRPAFTILILIILLLGCKKEEEKKLPPELSGFTYSTCGGFKSMAIIANDDKTEKLVIRAEADGYYKFDHTNVSFNCCLPQGISANLTLSSDTLYLNEYETVRGNCKCLCIYDMTSEIKDLRSGNYVLCLLKDSIVRGSVSLAFNDKMYEEIVVSDLIE